MIIKSCLYLLQPCLFLVLPLVCYFRLASVRAFLPRFPDVVMFQEVHSFFDDVTPSCVI